jgi:uncharacterized protein (DUF2249 family)
VKEGDRRKKEQQRVLHHADEHDEVLGALSVLRAGEALIHLVKDQAQHSWPPENEKMQVVEASDRGVRLC